MSAYGMPRAQTQAMNQSSPAMRGASALRYGILHTACCKLPLSATEARRVGLTGLERY
jgi:hypothetical protein